MALRGGQAPLFLRVEADERETPLRRASAPSWPIAQEAPRRQALSAPVRVQETGLRVPWGARVARASALQAPVPQPARVMRMPPRSRPMTISAARVAASEVWRHSCPSSGKDRHFMDRSMITPCMTGDAMAPSSWKNFITSLVGALAT